VLQHSICDDYNEEEKQEMFDELRNVLGALITLLSPLPSGCLAKLLGTQREHILQTLEDLHAILDVPSQETQPIRLHHPSFRDFLFDASRCNNQLLWIDERQRDGELMDKCLQIMSKNLKYDICDFRHPGTVISDIDSRVIGENVSPELEYACLYWIQHALRSGRQLQDDDQVHAFLQEHFLHWIEVMSLAKRISEAVLALSTLECFIEVSDPTTILCICNSLII